MAYHARRCGGHGMRASIPPPGGSLSPSAARPTAFMPRSTTVVPSDLLLAPSQESRCIVVEDVAPLCVVQERWLLDGSEGVLDDGWPEHLVRYEHHSVPKPGLHDALEITIRLSPWQEEDDAGDIDVDLRVRIEDGQQVIE